MHKILKSYLENRYFLHKYREEYTSPSPGAIWRATGQCVGPTSLSTLTADLPTTADSTTATFTDDTAVLTTHEDLVLTTRRLQTHLNKIQLWLKKWRVKANETKSVQVTFILKKSTCPPVHLNNKLTQTDDVKYLGIHVDRKHT